MNIKFQTFSKKNIIELLKVKVLIGNLQLQDIKPEDIADDAPLFGEGLGLESIDAFYIAGGIQESFGVVIDRTKLHQLKNHFQSVNTLAAYVSELLGERYAKQGGNE